MPPFIASYVYLCTKSAEEPRKSSDVAIFGAASEDDGRAVQEMREVIRLSQNRASKLLAFKNAGHGVQMFAKEKQLESNIINWFKAQLREAP